MRAVRGRALVLALACGCGCAFLLRSSHPPRTSTSAFTPEGFARRVANRVAASATPEDFARRVAGGIAEAAGLRPSVQEFITAAENLTGSPSSSAVIENLLALERTVPPYAQLANSTLLNGAWAIVYAGSLTSPGLLAYQILKKLPLGGLVKLDDVTLSISRSAPRVEAKTSFTVGRTTIPIRIVTDVEVVSDQRLKERYVEGYINNIRIPLSNAFSREVFVTYVDEDLLIVRDSFGVPEVLKRLEKVFATNDGEPSVQDDDGAPGAG